VAWVRHNHQDCFLSAVTIGELVKGLELLPDGKKRRRLSRELRFLQQDYRDRILPYDELSAVEWGRLYAAARKQHRRLPLEDSLIEATALSYELVVVTHNPGDFFRVATVDPWLAC
jgi:predicted nucleic acid-binding protein